MYGLCIVTSCWLYTYATRVAGSSLSIYTEGEMKSGNRVAVWVDIHKTSPLADVMVHKTLYSHYFSYFGTAMAPFWKPLYNESIEVLIQSADESYADSIKVSLDILCCHSDSNNVLPFMTSFEQRSILYTVQVLNLVTQSSVTS